MARRRTGFRLREWGVLPPKAASHMRFSFLRGVRRQTALLLSAPEAIAQTEAQRLTERMGAVPLLNSSPPWEVSRAVGGQLFIGAGLGLLPGVCTARSATTA